MATSVVLSVLLIASLGGVASLPMAYANQGTASEASSSSGQTATDASSGSAAETSGLGDDAEASAQDSSANLTDSSQAASSQNASPSALYSNVDASLANSDESSLSTSSSASSDTSELTYVEDNSSAAAFEHARGAESLGYVPDEIIVGFTEDATATDQAKVAQQVAGENDAKTASFNTGDVALLDISDDATVADAIEAATSNPAVAYAVPNYLANVQDPTFIASTESSVDESQGDELTSAIEEGTTEEASGTAVEEALTSDDGLSAYQWYLSSINAVRAWEKLSATGRSLTSVKVGVLDTGALLTHPDLKNVINKSLSGEIVWSTSTPKVATMKTLRGDGYTNGSSSIALYSTHGTHVAGIIAAEAGNGGVLGVASGGNGPQRNKLVNLVMVDVFSQIATSGSTSYPTATLQDLFFGLEYERDKGCKVINLSLGFYGMNEAAKNLMNQKISELVRTNNIVVVCATGNDNSSVPCYPAACTDALSVISVSKRGAIDSSSSTYTHKTWETNGYMRSSFSNYGTWAKISAPGEKILSTGVSSDKKSHDYRYLSGTSMAAPVVSAVVALVRAANSSLTALEVMSIIESTATDLNTKGFDAQSGYGLINAEKAVSTAISRYDASTNAKAASTNTWKIAKMPTATNKVYTGKALTGVSGGTGVVIKNGSATKVGTYTATVTPAAGYAWDASGNRAAKKLTWKVLTAPKVTYQTYLQKSGWQKVVANGTTSGTTSKALRVEGLRIKLAAQPYTGSLYTQAYIQGSGWQKWKSSGAIAGTLGKSKRIEAFRVKLTGTMAQKYDIYYRAYVQKFGWTGWAKNGSTVGTKGYGYRVQAVQVKIVAKNAKAPGSTKNAYRKK
jgi:subtilisin family serine protease